MKNEQTSEIRLKVKLDAQKLPERITWEASEAGGGEQECKAFMLSLWDEKDKSSLRIDLWTKDMRMDDMTRHFIQTLISMAQTYERATNAKNITAEVKKFCDNLTVQIHTQFKEGGQGS